MQVNLSGRFQDSDHGLRRRTGEDGRSEHGVVNTRWRSVMSSDPLYGRNASMISDSVASPEILFTWMTPYIFSLEIEYN